MTEYIERTVPAEWIKPGAYIVHGRGTSECKWIEVKTCTHHQDAVEFAYKTVADSGTFLFGTLLDVLIPVEMEKATS